jgi:hypothetical protein
VFSLCREDNRRLSGKGIAVPNALSVVRRLGVGLLSALLPANCYVCGALAGRAMVCPRCRAEFPLLPAELCPVCALASPAGAICGACRRAPPPYAASLALYPYAFPIRELIHALKFDANFGVLGLFSEELAQAALRVRPSQNTGGLVITAEDLHHLGDAGVGLRQLAEALGAAQVLVLLAQDATDALVEPVTEVLGQAVQLALNLLQGRRV